MLPETIVVYVIVPPDNPDQATARMICTCPSWELAYQFCQDNRPTQSGHSLEIVSPDGQLLAHPGLNWR